MHQEEITTLFNQQAAAYDQRHEKTAPIRNCMYLLLESAFGELPHDARILCVGVGTGEELAHLAKRNPRWRFTAVEPAGLMLEASRQRAAADGFESRCHFHEGYLGSLSDIELHDAATCFLVSQFILEKRARSEFFREIATNLKPGGLLASADLASDTGSAEYEVLLHAWMSMVTGEDASSEAVERMGNTYAKDVGIVPPQDVASIIESGGFEPPVQFFQAGLIHAWLSKRAAAVAA